ncbi:uncharacterized protein [Littorina saxatilis]|uniref:uncharacterized protein n=1 Tax=Littorina saxatilis TaxID=31220 RepID=UPI0038B642CC
MQLKTTEVEPLTKELYSGYGWKILLNLMKLGPPSSIVIVMLISLLKRPRPETCLEKIQALMSPEDSWGPALVKHRIMVNYVSGFVLDPSSMNSDGSYDNPKKDQKRTKPHTFGTRIGSSAENKNTGLASSSSSSDNTSSDISCSSDFGKSRSERTTRSSSREGEQADNELLSTNNARSAIALSKQGSIIKDPSEKRGSTYAPKKVVSLNLGGKSNVVLPGTTSVDKVHSRGTIGSTDSDYMFGDSRPPTKGHNPQTGLSGD